ncbi:zinc-binding dehydrogenase [Pseudonocardia sp. RS010]|uniref:zinc-binding dehydrogenase n=1 Tax=Pseudonocardia sp. RS010 TaxID=3385979 RepID=UPI00399FA18D
MISLHADMWTYRLSAPGTFERCQAPAPDPADLADGQVLLRLAAGGLCGSDFTFFRGGMNPAVPVADESDYTCCPHGASMHEVAGEVVASRDASLTVGSSVVGWATGMNAISEFVVTDGTSLAVHDPSLSASTAVMMQPLACVVYAVSQMSTVEDADAAVLGLGPIGVLFAHVLKTTGARRVVGVDRVNRADVARSFLIDQAVHASVDRWAHGLTPATRPTLVVEAIGHQSASLAVAVDATAYGGEIYYFGVPDEAVYPIPMREFLYKNLQMRAGATPESVRRQSLAAAGEYMVKHPGLVDRYITNIYPIDKIQDAFDTGTVPAAGQLKVVVEV